VDKKPLIGVSICAVVLIVLASLTNVVGYQTVQSSNQKIINEEASQKELLFQTIIDMTNNNEIQRIIFKSQFSREGLFNPIAKFSIFNTPVLMKNQLKQMYLVGTILSKIISKSRIHSMVEQYQLITSETQREINTVIEKDATLNAEITQLQNSECDCENENITNWHFPVLCTLLFTIFFIFFIIGIVYGLPFYLYCFFMVIVDIATIIDCFWVFW
jgi:hypothetical protein